MSERNFREMLENQWSQGKFVCVGLDSQIEKIPEIIRSRHDGNIERMLYEFNSTIVEATKDLVCAYKPNLAFFEREGEIGWKVLRRLMHMIQETASDVPIIADAKRGDIGNTNQGYVEAIFDDLQADAVTVHPYLGAEALKPFLDRADKGIIVLCRTSNPGAGEFQDLLVESSIGLCTCLKPYLNGGRDALKIYEIVAHRVARHWNNNSNCAVVVGATYPHELAAVREIVGDMPILIPGIGAQGGDLEATVKAGKDKQGRGMIINSSRGIIFASSGSDFAQAARRETLKLHESIKQYL